MECQQRSSDVSRHNQRQISHTALEHRGDNPFEKMQDVVHDLRELKKKICRGKTALAVNPPDAKYSTMLIGGQAGSGYGFNAVPEQVFITIDRRINPEENLDEAKKEIMNVLDAYKKRGVEIKCEVIQEGESSEASPKSKFATALRESITEMTSHVPSFELCPGICEIRFFNNRGIPGYAYGPGLLEVSHGPDEYVEIDAILDCIAVYAFTVLRLFCNNKITF